MAISLQERANLIVLYSTPNRHYHNWNHVEHCYRVANEIFCGKIPQEIEYAICYHDSVYDPYSKSNEEESAKLFLREHTITNGDYLDRDTVVSCILNTKNHFADTTNLKNKKIVDTFLDIDLSIFGSDVEYYRICYSDILPKEYYATPYSLFQSARKNFIVNVLKSDRIYRTEAMHKYEKQARENLTMELERLSV